MPWELAQITTRLPEHGQSAMACDDGREGIGHQPLPLATPISVRLQETKCQPYTVAAAPRERIGTFVFWGCLHLAIHTIPSTAPDTDGLPVRKMTPCN